MKKLLLTSSGLTNQLLIDALVQLLPKVPGECRAAVIPTAAKPAKQEHIQNRLAELRSVGLRDITMVDLEDHDDIALREQLQRCNVVFVNGGNTFRLLYWTRQSGFGQLMPKLLERGVVYVGVSAGSYLVCPTIEVAAGKTPTQTLISLPICRH